MLTCLFLSKAQVSGILAALCVTGAIFQNLVVAKVSSVLPDYPLTDIVHLTTGTSSPLFQELSEELKRAVIAQVTDSIRNTFIYVLAVASLGFVLSFFLSVSGGHIFFSHNGSDKFHPFSARSCTSRFAARPILKPALVVGLTAARGQACGDRGLVGEMQHNSGLIMDSAKAIRR
jgi:hypothetical protein